MERSRLDWAVLDSAGHSAVPVQGILCFVDRSQNLLGENLTWIEEVGVGNVNPVIRYTMRPGDLDALAMRGLYDAITAAFRIQGGQSVPAEAVSFAPPIAPVAVERRPLKRRPLPAHKQHIVRVAVALLAVSILSTVAVALLASGVRQVDASSRYMTRAQLHELRPELRRVAARHAGGPVSSPRIATRSDAFVLIYRRGRRCRVTVTVSRLPKLVGRQRPTATAARC